jgi:hypothetical protein
LEQIVGRAHSNKKGDSVKIKILAIVILGSIVNPIALAQGTAQQQASPSNTTTGEIKAAGTPNCLAKFTAKPAIGDSGICEGGGNIITTENLSVGAVSASVSSAPGIAVRATSTTTEGSTEWDAFGASGVMGVLAETSSPAGAAIQGMAYAPVGDPVGVFGRTASSDRGIGVRGQAVGNAGTGIGVLGEALSSDGHAGVFNHMAPNGYPTAVLGYSSSADGGEGVHGQTNATTGLGIGVNGITASFDGFGGSFTNYAGGNILRGVNNAAVVFRVDGNSTVFANGGFQPGGADFAESMAVSGDRSNYLAGDVLVIDASSD